MVACKLSRRTFIGGASASFVATANPGGGAMRNLVIRTREVITVTERGASFAGLAAAMHEASLRGGGVVRLQARSIRIDSAELAAAGSIRLPQATTVECEGVPFLFGGSAIAPPLFASRDASRIAIRNVVAVGNDRAVADARSGAFALFEMSAAAANDIEDIRLENVQLSRFGGERWIQFLQRNVSGCRMSGLRIVDLRADGGSSIAPAAIGVSAAPLWIHGVDGEIHDVEVRRLAVEAEGLKQGVVLFHKVRDVLVDAASISDAGAKGAADDAGAYAIMAYADPGEMSGIQIVAPTVRSPRSVGVYLRGVQGARVVDAVISGQTDTVAANLPKGAIALNGSSKVTITGGDLSANAFDISVADGGLNTLDLDVRDLKTTGSRTSVMLAISPGAGAISGARFINCDLSAEHRVFRVMNEQVRGRHYDHVWLLGGSMRSETAANVIELTQGEMTGATGYRVEDITVQANNVGIMSAGLQGSLRIRRTTVEGLGRLSYGIIADDCPQLDWDVVTFRNIPSGYAYAARSRRRAAKGSLRGLRFVAVGHPTTRGSLASAS